MEWQEASGGNTFPLTPGFNPLRRLLDSDLQNKPQHCSRAWIILKLHKRNEKKVLFKLIIENIIKLTKTEQRDECCIMSHALCMCEPPFCLSPLCVIHPQVVPTSYHHKYCCSEHLHTCPLLKLCNRSVGYTLRRESLGHGLSCPEFDQTVPDACLQ